MDLIRKILLNAESGELNANISGIPNETIRYHQALAIEAGLLKGNSFNYLENMSDVPSAVNVLGITWEGHDFIDAVREDTNWQKVKSFLADSGKQLTIETIKIAISSLFGFSA
jgi:hypothetical protein